jgi:hypothetical protein
MEVLLTVQTSSSSNAARPPFIGPMIGVLSWNRRPVQCPRREYVGANNLKIDGRALTGDVDAFTFHQGDMVYIPRGFVRAAECGSEPSLHITLGVTAYTWEHIFLTFPIWPVDPATVAEEWSCQRRLGSTKAPYFAPGPSRPTPNPRLRHRKLASWPVQRGTGRSSPVGWHVRRRSVAQHRAVRPGRSPSIICRMRRNKSRDTATSLEIELEKT